MQFEEWTAEVRRLAATLGVDHLIASDDDLRSGFDSGYSPTGEVDELINSARVSA